MCLHDSRDLVCKGRSSIPVFIHVQWSIIQCYWYYSVEVVLITLLCEAVYWYRAGLKYILICFSRKIWKSLFWFFLFPRAAGSVEY